MPAHRVLNHMALVRDAAGYVTKCSGEGIYILWRSAGGCARRRFRMDCPRYEDEMEAGDNSLDNETDGYALN
ncbi:hypothetical protein KSP40_PGU003592 [Platanthera guangdongensis]|uniref:Uncharacterized protein n=1 Tax=Platanthera guangdongensis TaxID=2320717 RepID=A0ABR2M0D2_9ASPA